MLRQITTQARRACDLATVVQCKSDCACTSKVPEIRHFAVFPNESSKSQRELAGTAVVRRVARVRNTNYLSLFVDHERLRVGTAQSAQILHDSVLPKKRPITHSKTRIGVRNCSERGSDHLAAAVNGIGSAGKTTFFCQRTKFCDLAILPEHRMELREPEIRIDSVRVFRDPGDQSTGANHGEAAARISRKHTEVRLGAVVPLERMGYQAVLDAIEIVGTETE